MSTSKMSNRDPRSQRVRPVGSRGWPLRSSSSRSGSASSRSRTRTRCCSPTPATRSATSSSTTWRSATASSARCASGRPSCGGSRTGSRASRSTRSASPRSAPSGSRRPASRSRPAATPTSSASPRSRRSSGRRTSRSIDFHPWPSRRADTEHPDELRIDIDPQPGTTFADAKRVAAVVRETLDEIGYVGWPKTSGNRGIHIAVPDRAELGVPGRAPLRARVRARDRAARARARDDRLVEGGARREGLHRLQPERPRPHDRLGVLGARRVPTRPSRRR